MLGYLASLIDLIADRPDRRARRCSAASCARLATTPRSSWPRAGLLVPTRRSLRGVHVARALSRPRRPRRPRGTAQTSGKVLDFSKLLSSPASCTMTMATTSAGPASPGSAAIARAGPRKVRPPAQSGQSSLERRRRLRGRASERGARAPRPAGSSRVVCYARVYRVRLTTRSDLPAAPSPRQDTHLQPPRRARRPPDRAATSIRAACE